MSIDRETQSLLRTLAPELTILAPVRDRGVGFDPDAVPEDRLGVRNSIVDRLARHGGTAEVRSTPGEGTEIRLRLPREPHEDRQFGERHQREEQNQPQEHRSAFVTGSAVRRPFYAVATPRRAHRVRVKDR